MTQSVQSTGSTPSRIRILCVDDPAVRLYVRSGDLISTWCGSSGYDVDLVVLPWNKYPDTIFSALKSGSKEYDVVMLPGYFWLPGFAVNKWLTPLTELAKNNDAAWKEYCYEDILPALRKELEIDGTVYLLPSFSEVQIVYYRKDLLEKAGLKPLASPITLDLWLETARKLHDPQNGIFGTQFKGSDTESMVEWLPFYTEAGGTLPDGERSREFPTRSMTASFKKLIDFLPFCREDVGNSDNATLFDMLTQGTVGIANHWSGQLGPIMDYKTNPFASNYGFAALENPWGTVWAFGIPSASMNKDAAFSCLLHMTGAAADVLQGDYSGSPARRSTFNDTAAWRTHPWFPALLECIERKHTFPDSPKFADLMSSLYAASHRIFAGLVSPEKAILELNRQLDIE